MFIQRTIKHYFLLLCDINPNERLGFLWLNMRNSSASSAGEGNKYKQQC